MTTISLLSSSHQLLLTCHPTLKEPLPTSNWDEGWIIINLISIILVVYFWIRILLAS